MTIAKPLAIAVVTAVTATGLAQSILPDRSSMTPEGRHQQSVEQLSDHKERMDAEKRARGRDLQRALEAEQRRSREVR